jgi:hypothetical protein
MKRFALLALFLLSAVAAQDDTVVSEGETVADSEDT